jgi:hypothetical protein
METPCIHVCLIAADTKLCEGCARTIDEIASWSQLTSGERSRIMRDLSERRRRFGLCAES